MINTIFVYTYGGGEMSLKGGAQTVEREGEDRRRRKKVIADNICSNCQGAMIYCGKYTYCGCQVHWISFIFF